MYYIDGNFTGPPKNPLIEKWEKLYPSISLPQFSQVCDGYSCIWCGRCPNGDKWEVPKEDIKVYNDWTKKSNNIIKITTILI